VTFSVQDILDWTSGRLVNGDALGSKSSAIQVGHAAPLGASQPGDVAFFFSKEYQNEVISAKAGILITAEPFVGPLEASGLPIWKNTAIVACRDPYYAMALISEKIAAHVSTIAHVPGRPRGGSAQPIHPTAVVHPSARLGEGVQIGPYCVIEEGAEIGARTILYSSCFVGPKARVGEDCVLFPQVTLYEWTELGDRVRLHAGVVLGADGFGYAPIVFEGKTPVGHQKIYHLGRVVVGDDVEIGANSMVDRSTFGETRIGSKVKIDNHCHVGHNATIEEGAILCGAVCLAGGTRIGKYAYLGGMSGIGNRAYVGDYAKVGAMSLVDKDVPSGAMSVGNPQRDHRTHFRAHAILNRLVEEHAAKRSKK